MWNFICPPVVSLKEISGLDAKGQAEGVTVYHAGTTVQDGAYRTSGGRVLGVTALGADLDKALEKAYGAVEKIKFGRRAPPPFG